MKNLVLFLSFFLSVGLVFSCKDDDGDDALEISFTQSTYGLTANEPLTVKIVASKPVIESTNVKFSITGTAVKDEDYTLSAEEFVIPAGATSAAIEVTPKENVESDRNIKLSLLSGTTYRLGDKGVTLISVEPKEKLIYSFETENYVLYREATVVVEVKAVEGTYARREELHIPFKVGASSTAKENEHFTIEGGVKEFVIPVGETKASIKLKLLKHEEGKDHIVLEPDNVSARFVPGNYDIASVKIYGEEIGLMFGKWVFKQELTLEYIKTQNSWIDASDFANMPVNNSNKDTIEFISGEKDRLSVALSGDLKNYFRNCDVTYLNTEDERYPEEGGGIKPPKRTISIFELSKANVAFSATKNEERVAKIGFRIVDDNTLEVTLFDYEPVDFFMQIYDMMKAVSGPEDIPMRYYQIRYQFSRI